MTTTLIQIDHHMLSFVKPRLLIVVLFCSLSYLSFSQSIVDLYIDKNFTELIKHADDTADLSAGELYYIGYAFFQLENDVKAIEMYDKAIEKGMDDDIIYLYKGLSLRYDEQFEKAIVCFRTAIDRNPNSQKNFTELANAYLYKGDHDSALIYFKIARSMDYELGDPYLKVPYVYHINEDYDTALEEYRKSAELINKEDPTYIELLQSIGLLEYTHTFNFERSVTAYTEMLKIIPQEYDLYTKLIKAHYANKSYEQGDSLFNILKKQFDKGNLSKDMQKFGSVGIDEFKWNGQKVVVYKKFKTPEEMLDIMYKFYLFSEDGSSVERTLVTEKTIQFEKDGAKHLLCEEGKGFHRTFPYGWNTDEIDYESLKSAVIDVLDEKTKPSASSSPGTKKMKNEK